jgi:transcriptional regulator with XRE-family HTH domain
MTIAERLQKILDAEKLSPSQFADEIGVQRSSLSHILSGRNNPSFDYLIKILTRFGNMDANWILTGKGNMYKSDNKEINKVLSEEKPEKSKQDLNELFTLRSEEQAPYHIRSSANKQEHKLREDNLAVNQKDIIKIIEFYSDNTFAVYYPSVS